MDVIDILVMCLTVAALTVSILSIVLNLKFFRMQQDLSQTIMRDSTRLAEESKTVLNEIRISQDITGKQVKDQYDKLLDAAIQNPKKTDSTTSSDNAIQEVNERLKSLENTVNKGSSTEKLKEEIEVLKGSFQNLRDSERVVFSNRTQSRRINKGEMGFERFTENARKALANSQDEAYKLASDSIDVGHLLLGLLDNQESRAYKILNSLKIDLAKLRKSVENMLPHVTQVQTAIYLTAESKRVIESAVREAAGLKSNYLGSEHLLLGILLEDSTTATILNDCGVTLRKVREKDIGSEIV